MESFSEKYIDEISRDVRQKISLLQRDDLSIKDVSTSSKPRSTSKNDDNFLRTSDRKPQLSSKNDDNLVRTSARKTNIIYKDELKREFRERKLKASVKNEKHEKLFSTAFPERDRSKDSIHHQKLDNLIIEENKTLVQVQGAQNWGRNDGRSKSEMGIQKGAKKTNIVYKDEVSKSTKRKGNEKLMGQK